MKIKNIEDGVKRLFEERGENVPEFSLRPRQDGEYLDTLIFDGQQIPLFDMRYDSRIKSISEYAGKNVDEISALNGYSFYGRHIAMRDLLYREFGIAEFILHSSVAKIMAFVTESSVNMIAVMENGTCANMDYGNSMAEGALNQCQHRVITKRGMANDCAVGHLTIARQVAVYGSESTEPTYYDDDQYYLYGLSEEDVRKVFAVYGVLKGNDNFDDWIMADKRIRAAVDAVFESNRSGEPIKVEDVLRREEG